MISKLQGWIFGLKDSALRYLKDAADYKPELSDVPDEFARPLQQALPEPPVEVSSGLTVGDVVNPVNAAKAASRPFVLCAWNRLDRWTCCVIEEEHR